MSKPAVKGSVLAGIAEEVRALRDAGRLGPADLERRLGAEGVACLDSEIQLAQWYPIAVYGAMRELLRDLEGGGRDEYTMEAAAETARRLISSNIYAQLDYLKRWKEYVPLQDPKADAEARHELFRQQLTRVSTLYNSMFSFSTTRITADPDFANRFQLEYRDGGVMPRDGRLAVVGFWNELSRHWSPERRDGLWYKVDRLDHYVLRMTRDIADV